MELHFSKGFALIEVLIALVIVSASMLALLVMQLSLLQEVQQLMRATSKNQCAENIREHLISNAEQRGRQGYKSLKATNS